MPKYTGDKHMDPITQLKMLYKRKGIPLTPFGWLVLFFVLSFVIYKLYHVGNHSAMPPVDNFQEEVVKPRLRDTHETQKERSTTDGAKRDKIINHLGETGLSGGQVLVGGAIGAKDTSQVVTSAKALVETEERIDDPDSRSARKENRAKIDASQDQSDVKVKTTAKVDKNSVPHVQHANDVREKPEAPDAVDVQRGIVVPQDPKFRKQLGANADGRGPARITLDPKEFGGQVVELVENPNIGQSARHDENALPEIPMFERDDSLVPPAHLEHIPKPDPKSYNVRLLHEPLDDDAEGCGQRGRPLVLILVATESMNAEQRTGIRSTWYSPQNYERFKDKPHLWRVLFVMGRTYDSYDKRVAMEAADNGDLIQGDFTDSPYESTRKFLIATKYIASTYEHCKPKFVLKTEDNIFVNMVSVIGWLTAKYQTASKLYVGNLLHRDQPIRDWTHPLYVAPADYGKKFFPDMLKGPVYLFSYDVVARMTTLYRVKTPLAMEDGYIGVLMELMAVKPRHNEHFWLIGKLGSACNYLRMFFVQNVKPLDHIRLMQSNKEARKSGACLHAQHYDRRLGKFVDDENPN